MPPRIVMRSLPASPPPLPSLLLAAALAAAFVASSPGQEEPDLILAGGKILTVDAADQVVEALAIRGDRVLAAGSDAKILALSGAGTRVMDLEGRCVIPGLIETHCHSVGAARASLGPAYEDYRDIAGLQAVVRRIASEVPPGAWIRVPRVPVTRLAERRHPTTAELDEACQTHPVVFTCALKSAFNTRGLEELGFAGAPGSEPEGVEIIRDAQGGIRLLGGRIGALVAARIPPETPSESATLEAMRQLHGIYNSVGITSIFERASDRAGWNLFARLRDQGELTVRATLTFRRQMKTAEETRRFIDELRLDPREGDDWLRAGPLKITADGGIHWGNTLLSEPFGPERNAFYALPDDPEHRGTFNYSIEEMAEVFAEAHRLGWQMSCHVTGDGGVDRVLEALERSDAEVPAAPMRFNLIHAYFPDELAARRAARLGACVDTQAYLYYKDADFISQVYGKSWAERFIGLGAWHRAGVPVSPNSDHMEGLDPDRSMNSFNPFLTLWIAVARRDEQGNVHGPEQRLTREEALRSMTWTAAWQSFDEDLKGSLEPGKLADLVVLDRDFLDCPEDEIRRIRPRLTMVGGAVVYPAGEP